MQGRVFDRYNEWELLLSYAASMLASWDSLQCLELRLCFTRISLYTMQGLHRCVQDNRLQLTGWKSRHDDDSRVHV